MERLAAERCGEDRPALDRREVGADELDLAGEGGAGPVGGAHLGPAGAPHRRQGDDRQGPGR
jgi:hypothetical protein